MDKSLWDNSQQLRKQVQAELDNWGSWSRQGNRVDLGMPHQIAGATPPEHDPPAPFVVKAAEATEHVLSTWCATTAPGKRATFLLKLRYVERLPLEFISVHYRRKFKSSRSDSTVAAMLDESEWFYWLLTT